MLNDPVPGSEAPPPPPVPSAPPPPGPLLSPDGKYLWDGMAWVPAPQAPGYAFFGLRFWAYMLDGLLISTPSYILAIFLFGPHLHEIFGHSGNTAAIVSEFKGANLAVSLLTAFIETVYFVPLWVKRGQTVGMRAAGIECVDAKTMQPLTLDRALIRSAFFWMPGVLALLLNISALGLITTLAFIWAAFDPRKQGLHDKAAGSVVIMNRKPRGLGKGALVFVVVAGWVVVAVCLILLATALYH